VTVTSCTPAASTAMISASSLALIAAVSRNCALLSTNTIKNVTIVVPVEMMSCRPSE
jgi:hypothetical protein